MGDVLEDEFVLEKVKKTFPKQTNIGFLCPLCLRSENKATNRKFQAGFTVL